MTTRTLIDHGTFYEGPRWHDGRWWVSDFYRQLVLSFDPDGGDVREELVVEQLPSGLGWTPDGDLLVVSQMDHALLRRAADGTVTTVATFGEHCGGFANDMVVDAKGRAYIGNAGFDLMARRRAVDGQPRAGRPRRHRRRSPPRTWRSRTAR